MQIVGFMEDEVQSVLELVAAVLKLGNIEFKPESRCNGIDESRIKDKNGQCWRGIESDKQKKLPVSSVASTSCQFISVARYCYINKTHFSFSLFYSLFLVAI